MRTIYKYPILIAAVQKVEVHHNERSTIIHVGLDPQGQACVWVDVDPDGPVVPVFTLYIVGTGNPIPPKAAKHIGSFVQGPFVWHVYV